MFRTQNLCPGRKSVFDSRQKHFLFPSSKICFRNTYSRVAKLANICIRNNVSAIMFPSLARPLRLALRNGTKIDRSIIGY